MEYERLKGSYRIDSAVMRNAKSKMIVMHPLPRNEELPEEVDDDQRAAYFRQVCNQPPYFCPKICELQLLTVLIDGIRSILQNGPSGPGDVPMMQAVRYTQLRKTVQKVMGRS